MVKNDSDAYGDGDGISVLSGFCFCFCICKFYWVSSFFFNLSFVSWYTSRLRLDMFNVYITSPLKSIFIFSLF